ncbi:TatD family hydrolase [Colletotrichum higginsianum IMI 349063]|uniref:TatD family hydrolase n=1 Tax=Colletotrichum higginsianum (strain IMI 349063) TaxID=759273 RepID=A0A1B7Y5L2_COLHI|nr:TatD family hydrolase [Colletotrichum higginsianum IMI 349063]OBR07339.1 TatD family hydrolase [Colletotrichum higginsianum IMI 349063]
MAPEPDLLAGFPAEAPARPTAKLRFADVAVTATAKDFAGFYRGKQYHQPDFDAVLDRALAAGVEKVMLTGMSLSDAETNLAIARSRPAGTCFVTIGIHPYHAAEPDAEKGGEDEHFRRLAQAVRDALEPTTEGASQSALAAFGELGLDYDRLNHASKEAQVRTFRRQLDLFVEAKFDLPLFLHCRAAFDDFVDIIGPYLPNLPRRGLVHSFVGTAAQMKALVDMGFDVGVNGFSLQDRGGLEMVRDVPLGRLQIETDAPWGEIPAGSGVGKRYLANAPAAAQSKKKDKFEMGLMVKGRNESCAMDRVAYVVAGLKGLSVEEVADAAWRNSINMFGLGER